jgi:hypothetical protein
VSDDLLAAAAQAMGVPEPIAERSARARAAASGKTYEEILAAWAGGQAVAPAPAADAPAEAPTEEAAAPEAPTEEAPAVEAPAAAAPAAPAAATPPPPSAAAARVPAKPPVLEAPADRPLVTIGGGLVVLLLTLLLGVVFPSLPAESNEVRSSQLALSEQGLEGRDVYRRAMCASCHTQTVRAVVADVGVGPVTLSDTNQVIGYRRIGPDLSNVGGRLSAGQISSVLTGGSHPAGPLSQAALDALVTYLSESAYMQQQGDAS